jgi:hypothetical protein
MKKWIAVGAMAIALVAADASTARAQDGFVDENGDGVDDGAAQMHRFGRRGFLGGVRAQLTGAQRTEVQAALETLKASEATREEIHAALSTMLDGYGVEAPTPGDRIAERLGDVLTAEQLAEVQAKVEALKTAEAPREDIRSAVGTLLEGYGVEAPAPERAGRGRMGKFRGRRGGPRGPAPAEAPATDDAS